MKIKSASGNGRELHVNKNNRALTSSVIRTMQEQSTTDARSYNINSGLVTLTTAGESGVLYIKNNEDNNLHIDALIVILGPTTAGSATDTTRVRFYKNPTTGTLISTALAADTSSNRNFGSSNTLTADVYKGAEGNTITNGSVHIESLISPGNRAVVNIDETLTKGDSAAISYEPNDSNTSIKVMAALALHLMDPNDDV